MTDMGVVRRRPQVSDSYYEGLEKLEMERNKAIKKWTQDYVNGLVETEIDNPRELIDYTKKYKESNPDAMISHKMAARLCDEHKDTKNNNLSNMILNSGAIFNSGIFDRYAYSDVSTGSLVCC